MSYCDVDRWNTVTVWQTTPSLRGAEWNCGAQDLGGGRGREVGTRRGSELEIIASSIIE